MITTVYFIWQATRINVAGNTHLNRFIHYNFRLLTLDNLKSNPYRKYLGITAMCTTTSEPNQGHIILFKWHSFTPDFVTCRNPPYRKSCPPCWSTFRWGRLRSQNIGHSLGATASPAQSARTWGKWNLDFNLSSPFYFKVVCKWGNSRIFAMLLLSFDILILTYIKHNRFQLYITTIWCHINYLVPSPHNNNTMFYCRHDKCNFNSFGRYQKRLFFPMEMVSKQRMYWVVTAVSVLHSFCFFGRPTALLSLVLLAPRRLILQSKYCPETWAENSHCISFTTKHVW